MKTIILTLCLVVLRVLACAQIESVISNFERQFDNSFGGGTRKFIGTFEFQNLPSPLEQCIVNFQLEVPDGSISMAEQDWTLRLSYQDNAVRINGDTVFFWPGPHGTGDQYTGTFGFVPFRSGYNAITLYLDRGNLLDQDLAAGLTFRWCLSQDGELRYLGKGPGMPENCEEIVTNFFRNDSVMIIEPRDQRQSFAFEYRMVLTPLPKVGDTTTLHYYLKVNDEISDGCDITLDAYCVDVISLPSKMISPLTTGQEIEDSVRFITKPLRDFHGITLSFEFKPINEDRFSGQTFAISFILDENGNLKYINDGGFYPGQEKFLPNNFRSRIEGDDRVYEIMRNEGDSL